jgi:uncharacterized repeat protein (TIGR03803 family)
MAAFSAHSLRYTQVGWVAVSLFAAIGPARAAGERVVYSFNGGSDGAHPSSLIKVNGTLYGTTIYGGSESCENGCGTVFSVTPAGAEKVVYTF